MADTFTITVYSVSANGDTKEVCWNEYRSEWIGRAYTKAWGKRLNCEVIAHVVHNASKRSVNFTA